MLAISRLCLFVSVASDVLAPLFRPAFYFYLFQSDRFVVAVVVVVVAQLVERRGF